MTPKLGRLSRPLAFKNAHPSFIAPRIAKASRDEDDDARFYRLAERIAPSREELQQIRAKLPPSPLSYDDEGEQPF